MDLLVIAPTAIYKRGPLRKEINDTIKDSPEAVIIEQRVDSIMPINCDKSKSIVEQRIYQDMRPMNKLHKDNRARDLYIYNKNDLYEYRPMVNVSFPEMKLRRHTV
jgi:hypothetical protein